MVSPDSPPRRVAPPGVHRPRTANCRAPLRRFAPLLQYGSLQEALGRLDDGVRFKQQALARDPRSALVLVQIAMSYWHQRKYDDMLLWAQRALDVDPKPLLAGEFIPGVYWKLGDIDKFMEESLRRAVIFGLPDESVATLKQVTTQMQETYATASVAGWGRFMADQVTNERLDFDAILKMAFRRAVLYAAAGRIDEAFECLDQAIAFRDPGLVHLAVAPQSDALRGDRRFGERLKAMGLPHPD
jgi:tetratricopeptide (TPR) repeat protein